MKFRIIERQKGGKIQFKTQVKRFIFWQNFWITSDGEIDIDEYWRNTSIDGAKKDIIRYKQIKSKKSKFIIHEIDPEIGEFSNVTQEQRNSKIKKIISKRISKEFYEKIRIIAVTKATVTKMATNILNMRLSYFSSSGVPFSV